MDPSKPIPRSDDTASPALGTNQKPADSCHPSPVTRHPYVILTGNPNSGKTTLFNAFTGLRAKVGNYAGVTVERKEGKLLGAPPKADIRVLDLPGTYSLSPNSLDEQISRDVLLNRLPELPPPDLIVVVVDASNLQRNLYYATQVVELGHPTLIALNMVDVAEVNGHRIDAEKLAAELSVPVQPVVASTGQGVPDLKRKIISTLNSDWEGRQVADPKISGTAARRPSQVGFCQLPGLFRIEATGLANLLAETFQERRLQATAEALLLLSNEKALASSQEHYPQKIQDAVAAARKRLETHGIDWRGAPIVWRYARIAEIQQAVAVELAPPGGDVQRQTGLRSHAQSLGHVDFHRHHDIDVPEHFHVCAHSDGRIAGGSGLAGRHGRQTDSTRRFEFIAGERCDCRCRRGDCFSAANLAVVFVHRFSGRHGLHGARGVFDGSADEQGRVARQKFHPDAEFVRMRHSRHHGHAHD